MDLANDFFGSGGAAVTAIEYALQKLASGVRYVGIFNAEASHETLVLVDQETDQSQFAVGREIGPAI